MWWDGPMDGVSDCSPRLAKLLRYAGGTEVSTGSATLNPWSVFSQPRKIIPIVAFNNNMGHASSVTTSTPSGLRVGDVFRITGCQPTAWNGTWTVSSLDSPLNNRLIFSTTYSALPAMTTRGNVVIDLPTTDTISPARDCIIEFPAGTFSFYSPPPPLPQVVIRGQSKLSTIFVKRFHGGAFFQQNGQQGNGLILERFATLADPKYRPGYFCYLAGNAGTVFQPDNLQIKDMYVSQFGAIDGSSAVGGGLWQHGIVIDGTNRTSPQGIRIGVIENCEIFNCQYSGVYIKNGVGILMRGGGLFPASAAVAYPNGTGVYVAGGPTDPLTQSINCHFEGVLNNCWLNITKSSYCTWMGGQIGGLVTDASSHHWRIDTLNSGAVSNNLVDSVVSLVPPA